MNRKGFTLIELLVVIAIMAALAALAAGTYFRVRSAQMVSSTEENLRQLNTGFDRQWSAMRDQIEKEFTTGVLPYNHNKTTILNFCGGANETERAKALWMYLRMKQEYPQTFQEAHRTITVMSGPSTIISLPPLEIFRRVPNAAAQVSTNADAFERAEEDRGFANSQAAVLLYIIMTDRAARGDAVGTDVSTTRTKSITVNGQEFKVFVDSWGTPITYVRWYTTTPGVLVNDRPYARYPTGSIPAPNSQDPIDRSAKLLPQSASAVDAAWQANAWNNANGAAARAAIGVTWIGQPTSQWKQTYNWVPTLISAGANRRWDIIDVRGPIVRMPETNVGIVYDPGEFSFAGNPVTSDNIYSYRLRQVGARGD